MKLMKIYEKGWLIACFIGVAVGIFNVFQAGQFDHTVYFPFVVSGFCIALYFTKRNHRKFLEKHTNESKPPED